MHLSIERSRKALPVCTITAQYTAATFLHVVFHWIVLFESMYTSELRRLYVSRAPKRLIWGIKVISTVLPPDPE